MQSLLITLSSAKGLRKSMPTDYGIHGGSVSILQLESSGQPMLVRIDSKKLISLKKVKTMDGVFKKDSNAMKQRQAAIKPA
ncbi:hypothetical protein D3C72_2434360 [compost metagenome]